MEGEARRERLRRRNQRYRDRRAVESAQQTETLVVKTENCLYIYIYICMFVWYVRIPYMHSALFVRDEVFPHVCMHR